MPVHRAARTVARIIRGAVLASLLTVHAEAQDRVALLVGVERYDAEQLAPLARAEDDVESIGRALARLGFSVVTMTSSADLESRRPTTPAAILGQLDKRLADRHDGDTVVVAFFGHGVQFTADEPDADGAKELWLCPERARLDDRFTLLPLSDVLARVGRCGADRRLLLVDACRREGDPPADGPRAALLEPPGSAVRRPPVPAGVAAVFSCRPGERSSEIAGDAHGVFGATVLDYLAGRAPAARYPGDELVLAEFASHVRSRTRDVAEVRLDRVQIPDVVLPEGPAGGWALGPRAEARSATGTTGDAGPALAARPQSTVPATITGRSLLTMAVDDPARIADVDAAIARFRAGDTDGCRAVLDRSRAADPRMPPTGVTMAKLWLSVCHLEAALAELRATIESVPGDPEPHLMLGDLDFQERKIDSSAVHFEEATKLTAAYTGNPLRRRDFEIRCAAGNSACAESRSQWERAHGQILRWLELDPRNPSAHQRLGSVLFKLGRTTDALRAFEAAKRLDGAAVQPELAMAKLYGDAKLMPAARTMIERSLQAAGSDPSVVLACAHWYMGQKELQTAKSLADRGLAMAPGSLEAKVVRGAVALTERDLGTAERMLTAALAQSPDNFPSSNLLAAVLIESPDAVKRARALELAESNAARFRDDPTRGTPAQETLGWVYHQLGRREEAARIFEAITDDDTLSNDGVYYFARILVDRGDRARARELLEGSLAKSEAHCRRLDAVALLETLTRGGP